MQTPRAIARRPSAIGPRPSTASAAPCGARAGDVLGGRYVLLAALGEGTSGKVFRARDRLRDREVALKLFADAGRAAFECEVALEAGHPGLVRALDFGRAPAGPYLVLELAAGEPLDPLARDAEGAGEACVLLADQLLEAAGFLHARGFVHGDIKPANVRVDRRRDRFRARVVDYGLARPVGARPAGGTAAYAAPEVLAGAPVDGRADLFSIGVLLWELATGALPFGDPGDEAYPLRLIRGELGPASAPLPPALAAILPRLLSRAPEGRFASAGEARAALAEAAPGLEAGAGASDVAPMLAGREAELEALGEAARRAASGEATRTRLVGPKGSGRSRLLERAAVVAGRAGLATLLLGQEPGAKPPPTGAEGARNLLGRLLERAALLPGAEGSGELARAREALEASRSGGTSSDAAATLALAELLRLSAFLCPLWVGVDDASELSSEARGVLAFLARGEGPIAWVVAEDEGDGEGLSLGEEARTLGLPPLDEPAVRAALGSMLPGLVELDALAAAARRASGGSPRALVEGARELERRGLLRPVSGRYRLVGAAASRPVAEAFAAGDEASAWKAIGRLSHGSAAALGVLAAARVPCSVELFAQLAKAPKESAAAAVAEGIAAGLTFWVPSPAEGWGFGPPGERAAAAPRAREALASLAGASEARRVREELLLLLELFEGAEAAAARSVLAEALGDEGRAALEALEAGRAWLEVGRARDAAAQLERARALGAPRVALALGDALAGAGEREGALAAYDDARREGASPESLALRRGRLLARAGRYAEAAEALAARNPGSEDPAGEWRFWLAWSWLHLGRYDAALALAEPRAGDPPLARARLARAKATVLWQRGAPAEAAELLRAALSLAPPEGARPGEAGATLAAELEMSLATALRQGGDLPGAKANYERAIARFRRAGDVQALARCLNNLAITSYMLGTWEEARAAWESFADLAARLGDPGEQALSRNNLGLLFKDRGEHERARASLERALFLAQAAKLPRYEAMAAGNLAEVLTASGELDAAEARLTFAERLADSLGAEDERRECGRRRALLSLTRGDAPRALAQACEAAAGALRSGAKQERAAALLVAASACLALGKPGEAEAMAREAGELFATGSRVERARAKLTLAEALAALGESRQARTLAAEAAAAFAELGAFPDLERAERVGGTSGAAASGDVALEIAGALAAATGASAMLENVLERLLALTGAERGVVVLLEGEPGPRVAAMRHAPGVPEIPERLSAGIAARVLAERRAVVLADIGEREDLAARESVVELGLQAALAAPLLRGDRCLGLLYLDARKSPDNLARFGLRALEVAAAMLALPIDLLLARDREADRAALVVGTAERLLDSAATIDAALELVAEEESAPRRKELAARGRRRCAELCDEAEALLELLRVEGESESESEGEGESAGPAEDRVLEGVDLGAALRYALGEGSGRAKGEAPRRGFTLPPDLPAVLAEPYALVRALSQLVGCARAAGRPFSARSSPTEEDGGASVLGWRPAGAPGPRIRLAFEVLFEAEEGGGFGRDAWLEASSLSLRLAGRELASFGGRLSVERLERGRVALALLVVELKVRAEAGPADGEAGASPASSVDRATPLARKEISA